MGKKKPKRKSKADKLKNLVRGAVSTVRAPTTPASVQDKWRRHQSANLQVHKAISLAKAAGRQGVLVDFAKGVGLSPAELDLIRGKLGLPLTSLGLLPAEFAAATLSQELSIATGRILRHTSQLERSLRTVASIEKAWFVRDWQAMLEGLDDLVAREGRSFWEIELRLGVIQSAFGLEAMKGEASRLAKSSSGYNRFLLHYFGVRNEPAQASGRYRDLLRKKLEESELSVDIKHYLGYRLYGELQANEKGLAAVLAAENLSSTIDVFITLIKLLRFATTNSSHFSNDVNSAIERASASINSLALVLGISLVPEDGQDSYPDLESSSASGASVAAQRLARYVNSPTNTRALVDCVAAKILAPSDTIIEEVPETMLVAVLAGLTSRVETRSDGVAAEELAKVQLCFNGIPTVIVLDRIDEVLQFPDLVFRAFSGEPRSSHYPGRLNSELVLATRTALAADYSQAHHASADPTEKLIAAYLAVERRSALSDADKRVVVNCLDGRVDAQDGSTAADALRVLLARFQVELGDTVEALRTIVDAGLINERLLPLLPLLELFQGVRWARIKNYGPTVELAIALELYSKTNDDAKARTYKRYAIEELMKAHNVSRLPDLVRPLFEAAGETFPTEYFFFEVCDIYTMELLPNMANSIAVLQQRVQVLQELAKHCEERKSLYLSEALAIQESLSLNDGLAILDDSRVYVDAPRILNAINQQLGADYQRYKNLVSAGVGESESFAEFLQNIKAPTAKTFQVPKNDADDLLGEIVIQIRDKFLADPAYGLDIHLSRRIRHGTIASQLRGQLEAVGLIGQRPKAGADYEPPSQIIELCKRLEPKAANRVAGAFARFADGIDQLIVTLRDEVFQIHSTGKPRGIFDLTVTAVMLNLARGVSRSCEDINEFSRECVGIFWLVLSNKILLAKKKTEDDTKRALRTTFGKLQQELQAAGLDDKILYGEIQKSSAQLANNASIIASWIRVPNYNAEGKTYEMQKIVDIAVALVTGQRPGFKPIVASVVPNNIELDSYGLAIVVDMLYIALDNVCQHSGKKVDNQISLVVAFDENSSVLNFRITSEVLQVAKSPERLARLQDIRGKIAQKIVGEGARSEGKSGLLKLAAIVLQERLPEPRFEFIEPDKFELEFSLKYVSAKAGHGLAQ